MAIQIPEAHMERSRFPDGFRILQGKHEYVAYTEHSSIRVWPSDEASHYDSHTHSAIEIIMPGRGVAVYRLQDEVYRVQAGEILIIPSGCFHELTEPDGIQRYLLLFEPNPLMAMWDISGIAPLLQHPIYLHDHSVLQEKVAGLLKQVVDVYFRKDPLWNMQCYSYLVQMYVLLGRHYLQTAAAATHRAERRNIEPEILNSAITFINEHYMEDINLEEVAKFTGFSRCYFSRNFKQFSGYSFSEFLTRKRLDTAADLLVTTRQPIGEVARASGFGSMATFNRVFREYKKCTPSQYRTINGPAPYEEETKPVF